jgi:schlafen family protein
MPKLSATPTGKMKRVSVRRRVNNRILRFSLLIGAAVTVLIVLVFIGSAYRSLRRWQEINLRTLSEISCAGDTCDTSKFTTDWQLGGANYVVDTRTRYFISVPDESAETPQRFAPLDYSDTGFIARFREPASYQAPDGEIWRMYSRGIAVDNKTVEIIIGYAEKAPWKMVTLPSSMTTVVDVTLKQQADKIAAALANGKATLTGPRSAPSANADGFEVVDASTEQVLNWGPWLPIFLPKDTPLPSPGRQLYVEGGDLYIVQTDTDGRLLAISLVLVGSLWLLVFSVCFAFVSTVVITRALSRRFLRTYFSLTAARVPSLEEALQSGEGQKVEFKRGLSADETRVATAEDELLRSIAAFANTNDGAIFIGIDDSVHVKGVELDSGQRDRLERKVHQLVRDRIKPRPPVQVVFEEVRGLPVVKITVSRGEAPAHMLGGVVYLRDGSSDVQAQAEDLIRLVAEYAG